MRKYGIVTYSPEYRGDFIRFNREWIERFFRIEACDEKVFADPEREIIDKGGQIFIAVEDGKPVGCCALIYHPDSDEYELAKMAVAPAAQSKGIGRSLATALIEYARRHGAGSIFLEANTRLEASVRLYRKLGFKPVKDYVPAYERCDLFMRLTLNRDEE